MILAWGARVSPEFRYRVVRIAARIGCNPSWLMACMAFETGRTFSPSVKNPGSSATGLIQFMAATAVGLNTTVEKLAAMSAEEQLDYVGRYFQPFAGRIKSLSDCYMAILWPAAVGKAEDAVIFHPGSQVYLANKGLDIDHDGAVSKAEAAAFVTKALAEGMQAGNAFDLADQSSAPTEDRSPPTLRQRKGAPVGAIALPLLSTILPSILQLFSGRAQAQIAKATGADPAVAEQFMQQLIAQVGTAAGIPVTDAATAIRAVGVVTEKPDPATIKSLEDHSLDYLDKLAPLLERIESFDRTAFADTEASRDAAAKRALTDPYDPAKILTYFGLGAVGLLTAFLCLWITITATQGKPVGVEMWAALTGMIGWLTAKVGSIFDNRFGTTRGSAAKDVVISEMAKRGQA